MSSPLHAFSHLTLWTIVWSWCFVPTIQTKLKKVNLMTITQQEVVSWRIDSRSICLLQLPHSVSARGGWDTRVCSFLGPLCHLKGEGPLCSASLGVTTLREGDPTVSEHHSMHLPLCLRGHLPEGHGKCSAEHVFSHCLVCAVTRGHHTQMLCWLSWAPWAALRGHLARSPHMALDNPAQCRQMPEHLPVASQRRCLWLSSCFSGCCFSGSFTDFFLILPTA